jgi:hypothetical protein
MENNRKWFEYFYVISIFLRGLQTSESILEKKMKHARTPDIGNLELGTGTRTQESKNNTEQNYTNPIVINSIETNQVSENQQNTYQWRYCQKSYKRFGNLKNHEIVCSKK